MNYKELSVKFDEELNKISSAEIKEWIEYDNARLCYEAVMASKEANISELEERVLTKLGQFESPVSYPPSLEDMGFSLICHVKRPTFVMFARDWVNMNAKHLGFSVFSQKEENESNVVSNWGQAV